MSTTTTHDDKALRRAYGAVAAWGLLGAVGTSIWVGPSFGASVFVGALLAWSNLWLLARAVRNLLGEGGSAPWTMVAVFKLLLLLAITYGLLRSSHVEALGLALGFGALPLGIVFGGMSPASGPSVRRLNEETDHA